MMSVLSSALVLTTLLPAVVFGRCCVPEKMSGSLTTGLHDNEYIQHVFDEAKFQIDFSTQKVVVYEMDTMSKVDYLMIDWGKGQKYVRQNDGSCLATTFGHLHGFQRCVPKSAYDVHKIQGITDSSTEWWSFSLQYGFTSVSAFELEKSTCKPTWISLRWDTNDWPYDYRFRNVSTSVPSDSDLYNDMSDCVLQETVG